MDFALLGDRLHAIGLTPQAYREIPPRHAALRDDPAALALRLFRDRGQIALPALPALFGDAPIPSGFLAIERDHAHALVRLDLAGGLFVFSDWPGGVLPPGETTALLHRAASRFLPTGTVLDLGCGSGTLAMLIARHARTVTATDIDPRALHLARLNTAINRLPAIEFAGGSLFEPVAGRRFDLIVSQPPFLPLAPDAPPRVAVHAGPRGDELAREIIFRSQRHLTSHGRALIFADWPLAAGESLRERVPHDAGRLLLLASAPLAPEGYYGGYAKGIAGIRQCLAVVSGGTGFEEHFVLPHQWQEAIARLE